MRRGYKTLIIWLTCLLVGIFLAIPAHARRIKTTGDTEDFTARLQALAGEPAATWITELINSEVPEVLRDEAIKFACELLEDARQELQMGLQESPDWEMDKSFLSTAISDIKEGEPGELPPGFDRVYSFFKFVVPSLKTNPSLSSDIQNAFSILEEKYRTLRDNLLSVQKGLTHKKDIVSPGLNIAFRYLFPGDISDSANPHEMRGNLDAHIEKITEMLAAEDEYTEKIQLISQQLLARNEEPSWMSDARTELSSYIEPWVQFLEDNFKNLRNDPFFEIHRVETEGKNFFIFKFNDEIIISGEYQMDSSGRININKISLGYQYERGTYLLPADSLTKSESGSGSESGLESESESESGSGSESELAQRLKNILEKYINHPSVKQELNGTPSPDYALFRVLDTETFQKTITSNITYTAHPLFLALITSDLHLRLPEEEVYVLRKYDSDRQSKAQPVGFYDPISGFIAYRGENPFDTVVHELVHARFMAWADPATEDQLKEVKTHLQDKYRRVFEALKRKGTGYEDYNENDLVNEVIARLIAGLISSPRLINEANRRLNRIPEELRELRDFISLADKTYYLGKGMAVFDGLPDYCISACSIKLLADVGFVPDWISPSTLGFTKHQIDKSYYDLLYRYYVDHWKQLSPWDDSGNEALLLNIFEEILV
jgi:hypothetical protein